MKKLIVFLSLGVALTSCSDLGPSPGLCADGWCSYKYWENLSLGVDTYFDEYDSVDYATSMNFSEGSQRVFFFEKRHWDDPGTADDELTQFFWFQAPMDADEFRFDSEEELSEAVASFQNSCYCYGNLVTPVTGIIEGRRVGTRSFLVTVDVTYTFDNGEETSLVFSRRLKYDEDSPSL